MPDTLLRCGATATAALLLAASPLATADTVARTWNEKNLDAIRLSFPDPPVHARNLFHISVAMYDAWCAYDPTAVGYFHRETATAGDVAAARQEAISYAAYRVLVHRYFTYPHPITPAANNTTSKAAFDAQMAAFGYPIGNTSTIGPSPSAVGNRVAETIINWTQGDGSNEVGGYDDPTYSPVNTPLPLEPLAAVPAISDLNRWQPLEFVTQITQNGQILESTIQEFIGAHWGGVWPFALHLEPGQTVYNDPGPPPLHNGVGDAEYKSGLVDVIRYSSRLDPDITPQIDCSPGVIGNNTLGTNDGTGHGTNPSTGMPYAANWIREADFGRVLAEFWADGPDSETPPGHWNTLANQVVDSSGFERRFMGVGPVLDALEWDVKMYFVLNASVHDVAVAVWGCKREYDYIRPISGIRYVGTLGQSSDPLESGYNPLGLPLETDLVEVITGASSAPGQKHDHLSAFLGQIAIFAWGGEPAEPETQYTGSKWILPGDWLPYQRDTFVTPAFAGYTSGHSGFSRAAAEVLTRLTGDPFFPGGLGTHDVAAGTLEFENGPSLPLQLQWATYYDAADQAGLSRLYGGIHVPVDDGPGRIMGSKCGIGAWNLAAKYFDGSIATEHVPVTVQRQSNGDMKVSWFQHRGMFYALRETPDFFSFSDILGYSRVATDEGTYTVPSGSVPPAPHFFQVFRSTHP